MLCAGPPEGREGQAPEMAQWARSERIAEIGDVNHDCDGDARNVKFPKTELVEIIAIDDTHQRQAF